MAEPDQARSTYFDTPERTERLQLVAHLVRNARLVPYVRGPQGAGKTRFAERLAPILRQEAMLVELKGAPELDLRGELGTRFGVDAADWPAAALDAAGHGDLLLLVDDADRLDAAALHDLQTLHGKGARVLLLGTGDAAPDAGGWQLQIIDLPPYSEQQTRGFLAFLGIEDAMLPSGIRLLQLHRETGGWPGAIIEHLAGGRPGQREPRAARGFPWQWLLGSAAVLMVVLALWQQDAINALFLPPPPAPGEAARPATEVPIEPITTAPPAAEPQRDQNLIPLPPRREPAEARRPELPRDVAERPGSAPPAPADAAAEAEPGGITEAGAELAAQGAAEAGEEVKAAAAAGEEADAEAEAETAPVHPRQAAPQPPQSPPDSADGPADADSTSHAAAPPPPPPATPSVAPPPPAPEATPSTPAPDADLAWLRSRQPDRYTLQLVGARDPAALDAFVARHRLTGKYAVFARDLAGKPWYSLVYGDYPDRDAALRARAKLPPALRSDQVWPRSFASIRAQLPPASQGR